MATINPMAEAKALADRLRADARDPVEARAAIMFALQALHSEMQRATQVAEEHKAALVLAARASVSGESVDDQKAEVALLAGKHPSTVTALEVTEALPIDPAPPVDVQPAPVDPAPAPLAP